jgi:hypothetical protein
VAIDYSAGPGYDAGWLGVRSPTPELQRSASNMQCPPNTSGRWAPRCIRVGSTPAVALCTVPTGLSRGRMLGSKTYRPTLMTDYTPRPWPSLTGPTLISEPEDLGISASKRARAFAHKIGGP